MEEAGAFHPGAARPLPIDAGGFSGSPLQVEDI
jgi:hypothetical protein